MSDQLTMLENKMDATYTRILELLTERYSVSDWSDYTFRIGYLGAIRDIGRMVKEVRNPELPHETGEIPSILEEQKNG